MDSGTSAAPDAPPFMPPVPGAMGATFLASAAKRKREMCCCALAAEALRGRGRRVLRSGHGASSTLDKLAKRELSTAGRPGLVEPWQNRAHDLAPAGSDGRRPAQSVPAETHVRPS